LYSCAFFSPEARSLEAAQENKIRTTLDRLVVGPGMTVLDIGCGWGAMTRAIAARDAHAIGITLADRQLALAEQRVPARHADMISYKLQDYRDHARENRGKYDRVVSIGMFEHVGKSKFESYFSAIYDQLKPDERLGRQVYLPRWVYPENRRYVRIGGWCRPRVAPRSVRARQQPLCANAVPLAGAF
ncbi:MAG: class I SAM-dependent methyltransferase, partial [Rickettsiales bacterium]